MTNENILEIWKKQFLQISNKHAPFKNMRVKDRRNKWINSDVLEKIIHRDKVHHKAISSKSIKQRNVLWKQYCRLRNDITKEIRELKKQHYHNIMKEHSNNPK